MGPNGTGLKIVETETPIIFLYLFLKLWLTIIFEKTFKFELCHAFVKISNIPKNKKMYYTQCQIWIST